MSKKRAARRVARTTAVEAAGEPETETDKYKARLAMRLAGMDGLKLKVVGWLAIFEMIMEMIAACQSLDSARIVWRTANPRFFLQLRMVMKIRRLQKRKISIEDASDIAQCIIDEAEANPKGMVKFIDEARASMAAMAL